jgi:DNA uptake protein ComE-like DNA-binding protein
MTAPVAPRRAMVLFAVLLVLTIAALVGAAGMYSAEARVTSASASLKAAQARALAWSGVQALMAEMSSQREALIAGQEPMVSGTWELFKVTGGGRGIVRLLPVGAAGKPIESEAAKLDVNTASAAMLAKLPGSSEAIANAIVAARGSGPIRSIREVPNLGRPATEISGPDRPPHGADAGGDDPEPPLESWLTAYAFDPCIQLGLGKGSADHRGHRRLDVHVGTSPEFLKAVEARFDGPLGAKLKGVLKAASGAKSRVDLVRILRTNGVGVADWGRVLDAFETSPDPYIQGRVDVNRAPAEVLAALPGFDQARAKRAVELRAGLSSDRLASAAWLVEQGVLTADQFEQASNYLAVRTFQWRVVVEAGVTVGGVEDTSRTLSDAPLASRVVLEAVIDLASQRPRVAFLSDVTLADAARELAMRAPAPEPKEPPAEPPSSPAAAAPRPAAPTSTAIADAPPPKPPIAEEPIDRRLGRWTAGARSGDQR